MKIHTSKIHLIWGLSILTLMGCNNGPQRGNYLYPNVASQPQDLTVSGDQFRPARTAVSPAMANLLSGMSNGGGLNGTNGQWTQSQLDGMVQAELKKRDDEKKSETKEKSTSKEKTTFTVNRDDEMRASDLCKGPRNPDTDDDKISDECESANLGQLPGIQKDIYNGFVVAGSTFTRDELKRKARTKGVNITKGEEAEDSWFDRRMAKWYINLVNQNKAQGIADQRAAAEILKSGTPALAHRSMQAKKIALYSSLDERYAMVPGVGGTAVPFGLEGGATSLANLSGIESTSLNLATEFAFVYGAMTNVVIPANLTSLEITAATLLNQNEAVVGSKAGIFGVFGNGNTEILVSDLIATKDEGKSFRKAKGKLIPTSGCETVQMAIFFVADKKIENLENIFGQAVVYKDSEGTWRTFSQDMLSVKPRGKDCKYEGKDMMFDIPELSSSNG